MKPFLANSLNGSDVEIDHALWALDSSVNELNFKKWNGEKNLSIFFYRFIVQNEAMLVFIWVSKGKVCVTDAGVKGKKNRSHSRMHWHMNADSKRNTFYRLSIGQIRRNNTRTYSRLMCQCL